jgi:hypothetical protein
MRPTLGLFAIVVFLGLSGAGPAFAQLDNGQENAAVAVHAQAHNTKGMTCSGLDHDLPCDGFTTRWPVHSGADVYFVVANANPALGVSGVSLGVTYGNTPGARQNGQGVDVFDYVSCADLEYPNGIDPGDPSTDFPAAGGGNRFLWDRTANCQRHIVSPFKTQAVVCAFYVYAYAPDDFKVDMNRNESTGPEFQITDCVGPAISDMQWPGHAGYVSFGSYSDGYNPCLGGFWDDVTPPALISASGAGGSDLVAVGFSEWVTGSPTATIGYRVYPTGDPSSALAVTLASFDGSQATLTLASVLDAGVPYTVEISNVQDASGNWIAPNSTIAFTASGEDVAPTLVSAFATGGNAVTVTFSEPVASGAGDVSNYALYPSADPSLPVGINAVTVSSSQVTLTLASYLDQATAYTLEVSNVRDFAGNPIPPGSTVELTTPDGDFVPPALLGAEGTGGTKLVTVTFSEAVGTGADVPSNYVVYRTSNPTAHFAVDGATVSGSRATLTMAANLVGLTSYTVVVSNVQDLAGNVIPLGSRTDFTAGPGGGEGGDQSRSVVALHVQAHAVKGLSCAGLYPDLPCGQYTTSWPPHTAADVYMVVALADPTYGVSGVSLGVAYGNTPGVMQDGQGCDVRGYTSCADLEYTNGVDPGDPSTEFPASGGGNRLIWVRTDNCQTRVLAPYGVQVVACAFYVYAYGPDLFRVDMNRNLYTGPEFQVIDCQGPSLSDMPFPEHAGYVGFGEDPGYNPCPAEVPTVRTSWGRLKTQYR